jgi:glycine cleavage system aminomethyltransferase T
MAATSLEAVLKEKRDVVGMLRNSKIGMYVYPVVAAEFSNWRDEQRAWRDTAVLFDQTHHMDEVIVEGPDAEKFLQGLAINSFANFGLNRAKHFVPVSPDGYVIGDMIIFREREDKFILVGRAAREKMKGKPHRRKVTFEWNTDDMMKVIESSLRPGADNYKWIDFPQPNYASASFDRVMKGDKLVGLSMFNGYSFNERVMLSLGIVDPDVKEGDVLTLIWGEPDGGSGKTSTERHKQAEIRVRVSPVPYSSEAREHYAGDSWRTRHTA